MVAFTKAGLLVFFSMVCILAQASMKNNSPQEYINAYGKQAVSEMKRSGVPASITLSQGMLESNNGNSTLSQEANNHFGIKCHVGWSGKSIYKDDDQANECFRHYNSAIESYADHSDFLRSRDRYAFLFDLKTTDYKGWANGLKRAGYATDPAYPNKLIKIIENYELYKFDQVINPEDIETMDDQMVNKRRRIDDFVISRGKVHEVKYNNGIKYIDLKAGDSFEGIAKEFDLRSWEIPQYNDLPTGTKIADCTYLYVSGKRNKAHRDHTLHTVKPGETLQYISQKYGVKLKRLYYYNNLSEGAKINAGDAIKLRSKK